MSPFARPCVRIYSPCAHDSPSSDGYDVAVQFVPYLTYSSPYTNLILSLALVSFLAMIPLVNMIPMRTTCLAIGLLPFFVTHPFTQHTFLPILQSSGAMLNSLRERALRFIDDDKLEDRHWRTELREVELWENERWVRGASSVSEDATKAEGTWAKNNLKLGERKAWTRGRDGWSGVADDGSGEVRYGRSKRLSSWLWSGLVLTRTHGQQQPHIFAVPRLVVC